MDLLKTFGKGLSQARKSRAQTQEDFSEVSSRTYMSSLERGTKAPTITKIDQISSVLGVHPVTLFALAYCCRPEDVDSLCTQIATELKELLVGPINPKGAID